MHNKHMVHLDLKPENILCLGGERPGYEEIKLIDFGMTQVVTDEGDEMDMCGTAEFVAPEVLESLSISRCLKKHFFRDFGSILFCAKISQDIIENISVSICTFYRSTISPLLFFPNNEMKRFHQWVN